MVKALLRVYYSVHDLSAAIATSVLISPPNRIHPPIHKLYFTRNLSSAKREPANMEGFVPAAPFPFEILVLFLFDICQLFICPSTYLSHRGYYTVARRYEFYFRVPKQYFTNERSE